jgi:hypothetical protein
LIVLKRMVALMDWGSYLEKCVVSREVESHDWAGNS